MTRTTRRVADSVLDLIDPLLGRPRATARELARVGAAHELLAAAHERLSAAHAQLQEAHRHLNLAHEASSNRVDQVVAERGRVIARYLDLIQATLTGSIYEDPPLPSLGQTEYDPRLREYGWDWPSKAHTMIGEKRLANVRSLVESVLGNGVPGDLIETGVWRGGACILMRAVLDAYGVRDRRVWLADSFEGLPAPDSIKYPHDEGDNFHTFQDLSVSLDEVKSNFNKYNLLDDQVVFLKGWFEDTLPQAPMERLALLRLDGDMYGSTIVALNSLYDRLSVGGYVIVDDYHVVEGCKQAIHDFLDRRELSPDVQEIDGVGVFWKK